MTPEDRARIVWHNVATIKTIAAAIRAAEGDERELCAQALEVRCQRGQSPCGCCARCESAKFIRQRRT